MKRFLALVLISTALVAIPMASAVGADAFTDKEAVRADLAASVVGDGSDTDERLEKAIAHLDKSMAPELWLDDDTLDPDDGKKVFEEEKKAVEDLMKIEDLDVSWHIAALVGIDQALAQGAIDNSESLGGDVAKAVEKMAKAADKFADGEPHNAIDQYKKAWDEAAKAEVSVCELTDDHEIKVKQVKVKDLPAPTSVETATDGFHFRSSDTGPDRSSTVTLGLEPSSQGIEFVLQDVRCNGDVQERLVYRFTLNQRIVYLDLGEPGYRGDEDEVIRTLTLGKGDDRWPDIDWTSSTEDEWVGRLFGNKARFIVKFAKPGFEANATEWDHHDVFLDYLLSTSNGRGVPEKNAFVGTFLYDYQTNDPATEPRFPFEYVDCEGHYLLLAPGEERIDEPLHFRVSRTFSLLTAATDTPCIWG